MRGTENREYETIYSVEDHHWWYVGLRELVTSSLPGGFRDALLLDTGCGTGGMLTTLNALGEAYGIDIAENAIVKCNQRNIKRLVQASVTNIPFPDQSFDSVVSLDVLYHASVDSELTALKEFYRVLKPAGKLIMNLPAFAFLYSAHDEVIHTKKRFTRREVDRMLRSAGFLIEKLSYRVCFLFPAIAVWKIFNKSRIHTGTSDLRSVHPSINSVLLQLLRCENRMLKRIDCPLEVPFFALPQNLAHALFWGNLTGNEINLVSGRCLISTRFVSAQESSGLFLKCGNGFR